MHSPHFTNSLWGVGAGVAPILIFSEEIPRALQNCSADEPMVADLKRRMLYLKGGRSNDFVIWRLRIDACISAYRGYFAHPCRHGNRMKQRELITLFENGACTAVIGLMVIAFLSTSVNAHQSPRKGCVAVSKSEYNSAKRQDLLRTDHGT